MKLMFRIFALIGLLLCVTAVSLEAASSTVVISQIYLGTGDTDARPNRQYVELFNLGSTTVNLQGWSLQYTPDGTNTWQTFPLSGSLAAGQYYLIRLNGQGGTLNLPQADLSANITLPLNLGKLLLVNDSTAFDTGCPTDTTRIVDLVGYGSTGCYEGRQIPALNSIDLRSYTRKASGCTETDNNSNDFTLLTPLPRNTGSARNLCGAPATTGSRTFSVANNGASSFQSGGAGSAINIGYARVQADPGSSVPAGVAIYGLRQGDTLISETGVPVSPLMTSGMTYVEIGGSINTGIAIANPNNENVTVEYVITDSSNVQTFITGTLVLAANSQLARFLNELPYAVRSVTGVLAFSATAPIAVTALRGFTNERGEFLVSTLPVIETPAVTTTLPAFLPHFAAGGGWRTELILVNTIDVNTTGTIAFFDQSGNPITVPIGTVTLSSIDYAVPPRRTLKFVLPNTGSTIQVGSVRVTPASGEKTPLTLGVFSYTNTSSSGAVRVSEAALTGLRGTQFRTYIENSGSVGSVGSILSGVAIANADGTTATVTFEAFRLDGTSTNLTTALTIPVGGKAAKFANELFPTLPGNFKGTLKITSNSALSVAGLRGRYNERSDFLITTVPLSEQLSTGSSSEVIFPHIADSGGYTTQFILFNAVTDQSLAGTVLFRTIGGQRQDLTLQ
jgi:hypothetical protein